MTSVQSHLELYIYISEFHLEYWNTNSQGIRYWFKFKYLFHLNLYLVKIWILIPVKLIIHLDPNTYSCGIDHLFKVKY